MNAELVGELDAAGIDNLQAIHCGMSSFCRRSSYYNPLARGNVAISGHATLHPELLDNLLPRRKIEVPIRTLDSLRLTNVDFIKEDVEGHEIEGLTGALQTIARCRPVMLVEVMGRNFSKFQELLLAINYHLVDLATLIPSYQQTENYLVYPN
jgi:FkbM family methyltransferase